MPQVNAALNDFYIPDQEQPVSAQTYLRDLAQRLMSVPTMHGVDQGDCAQLGHLAGALDDAERVQ